MKQNWSLDLQPAHLTVEDGIAVIRLDQQPVNAFNQAMRSGLGAAIATTGNLDVEAIVVIGANGLFSAGADVKEVRKSLGDPNFYDAMGEPNANDVFNAIERSSKPVIAAVERQALGGGMELALSCHYRIAAPNAQLGLPEAKLGIMPGAGGTQRLPRLIGAETAIDLMVKGTVLKADAALKLGIVDRIADGDLLGSAIAFAKEVARKPIVPVRDRTDLIRNVDPAVFEKAAAQLGSTKHLIGPTRIVEAVKLACSVDFDEALAREWDFFRECAASPAASGLIHQFLAEREVWKVPGVAKTTSVRSIEKAGVIGAGTMGGGIAMSLLDAGIPVKLVDASADALARGVERIRTFYAGSVAKGRLTQAEADRRNQLLTTAETYASLGDVDIVIEAVFERMDVKRAVFTELDRHVRKGAILATNTSTLDVNRIAEVTSRPGDVIGLHFFSPANIMRLVEIVRTDTTADDVIATSQQLCRRMRKTGVVVGVCDGFVGNRMVDPYLREAQALLLEGASPADVDGALVDFGLAMGVFAMLDMAGLDVRWDVEKRRIDEGTWDPTAPMIIKEMFDAGRYGQKNGAGYFRYDKGSRAPLADPAIEPILAREAARLNVTRNHPDAAEIVKRCLYGMVNEAAKILDEGVALRASDIDVIYVAGYGFPAYRGGPMHWADGVGLAAILDSLKAYHRTYGEHWRPAALIERLVGEGSNFAGYDARRRGA